MPKHSYRTEITGAVAGGFGPDNDFQTVQSIRDALSRLVDAAAEPDHGLHDLAISFGNLILQQRPNQGGVQ